ncbi:MAG: rhodanese-like domain-containing protein [Gammaproteobacteria bacterium]|nr:MAG: rhodanese-like domain-containing protein [Gammaproteobacteria bacterium]
MNNCISKPQPRKYTGWYLSGLLLLVSLLSGCSEPPYTNLDNDQLKAMLEQDVTIIDIRRPDEWRQTGVIEGSQLLTFVDATGRLQPDFLNRFSSVVGKDEPVILVCRTGNRTSTLARYLVDEMGYTQVYNVRNGITHWIGDKRPVIRL